MGELRRALACSAAVAAAAGGVVVAATPSQAASPECSFFDFRSTYLTSLSRLVRVDLPAGTTTDLGRLDYQVQAAGYSAKQGLVYGVATRDKHGWLLRRPRLLTVNSRGTVTDLGEVRRGVGGLADPVGGAVSGTRFYVRDVHRLFTIDIDPGSPTYRKVVGDVRLKPVSTVLSVDDFGVSPSGMLYGVSTTGHPAKLVSIDPVSGSVRTVASVPGIPWQRSYSSVMVGASGVYAVNTGYGRTTRVFRIGFDGSSRELASWRSMAFSEGAGCLPRVVPPPPPPPTPAPTPTPQVPKPTPRPTATPTPLPPRPPVVRPTRAAAPEPTPTPTTTPAPTPTPVVEPQVVAPPLPSPTPTPTPKAPPPPAVPQKEFVAAQRAAAEPPVTDRAVQVMRRWSLATVVLIMFGGAATAAARRMRRRS